MSMRNWNHKNALLTLAVNKMECIIGVTENGGFYAKVPFIF